MAIAGWLPQNRCCGKAFGTRRMPLTVYHGNLLCYEQKTSEPTTTGAVVLSTQRKLFAISGQV